MPKSKLKDLGIFLEDLTYRAEYIFLEEGKDDTELQDVGKKSGLSLPSKDLAVFKCIYAFVDMENKNGCTLPKEEVEARIHTLVGKAIDIDHFRKRTVGYWIHTVLNGDKILAYGAFWKNNFSEEFDEIKRMLQEGALKISFEAWGDRIYKGGKSYDLTNIEFAGGALLLTTQPAFAGAKVLEMAKDMSAPKEFLYERGKMEDTIDLEESQFHFHDYETIARLLYETECPSCKSKGAYMVDSLDFTNSSSKATCGKCGGKYNISFIPSTEETKKGKKIKDISLAEIKKEESIMTIEELTKELETVKASIVEKDKEVELIKASIGMKDAEIATMKTAIEESTKLIDSNKKALEESTAKLESLTKELEASKAETSAIKTELETAKNSLKAKEDADKAAKVKTRRDALGDFGKDVTDEDILDDLKFENATLKKALAEKNPELAHKLEIGSKDKSTDTKVWDTQKKVQEKFLRTKG
jgi:transcription elongation factor Elf1